MNASDGPVAARTGRPWRVPCGTGLSPADVLYRLQRPGPVAALWGRWFGGGALILTDPVRAFRIDRAEDAFDVLDDQPTLDLRPPGPGEVGAVGADRIGTELVGGGWLACLGYEPGHSWVGFFDQLWRYRPDDGWTFETLGLAGREEATAASHAALRALLASARLASAEPADGPAAEPLVRSPFAADPGAITTHLRGVESVIAGIERGDHYQLNLGTRLRSRLGPAAGPGAARQLFATVADRLRPAYGSLVDTGDGRALVSLSPELFVAAHGDQVRTAPIKGTSPLDQDPTGAGLAASVKDAAENVMITDLMRNDLSRVCRPGTVTVERLLDLERHPGLWHLVSTVAGRLRPGTTRSELLRAVFPPGSVTGAPKVSALAGIAATEPHGRGAYTGAFGLAGPIAGAEFSVIIRTFEIDGDNVELGVGGGITVDSVPVREWYECLHKAAPLVRAAGSGLAAELVMSPPAIPPELRAAGVIETLLARDGVPIRAAAHLARLDRSCRELYGRGLPGDLAARIGRIAAAHPGRRRIRVLARPQGGELALDVGSHPAGAAPALISLRRAERPPWSWRHKWADRTRLAEPPSDPDGPLTLPYYLTPDGFVAESSRGNLCLLTPDGVWVSPPESEHVLPGVTRRDLLRSLDRHGARTRVDDLRPAELRTATAVLHCSSVSGVVPVESVDGTPLPQLGELRGLLQALNSELGTG